MRIDCGTCAARGAACTDCVVTFLTIGARGTDDAGGPRLVWPLRAAEAVDAGDAAVGAEADADAGALDVVDLDDAERAAIEVLASSGLVPPLRLTPRLTSRRSRAG